VDLFGKNEGGDELGVGLVNDPSGDNEITPGSWIAIDATGIHATDYTISFNSVTGSDAWAVYGTNTAGSLGTEILSGADESDHSIATYAYYNVVATGGNVPLTKFDATAGVPEPSTWAMMGLGFLGLAFAGYRSRRATAAFA
jgi:hypothetical protein